VILKYPRLWLYDSVVLDRGGRRCAGIAAPPVTFLFFGGIRIKDYCEVSQSTAVPDDGT
jgi:hypothetical protein